MDLYGLVCSANPELLVTFMDLFETGVMQLEFLESEAGLLRQASIVPILRLPARRTCLITHDRMSDAD